MMRNEFMEFTSQLNKYLMLSLRERERERERERIVNKENNIPLFVKFLYHSLIESC